MDNFMDIPEQKAFVLTFSHPVIITSCLLTWYLLDTHTPIYVLTFGHGKAYEKSSILFTVITQQLNNT